MRNAPNVIGLFNRRPRRGARANLGAVRSALHARITEQGDVEYKVSRLVADDAPALLLVLLVMCIDLTRQINGAEVSYDYE